MMMSKRAYARHRGCSEAAVRKAVLDGRISADAEHQIDQEAADRAWPLHEATVRTSGANQGANQDIGSQEQPSVANASLVRQVLREEGQAIGETELSLTHVRMAVGILKAREQARLNEVASGELVSIEEVGQAVEAEYAVVRANLLALPGDVAYDLVGLDASAIEELLASKVAEVLEALSADQESAP